MTLNYTKHETALVGLKAVIGAGTRVWAYANILDGAIIGKECNICDGCFIEQGVEVGNYVTLKNHVCLFDGVKIEDQVFVGVHVVFVNDRRPRSFVGQVWEKENVLVKTGATIGSHATIMAGVTIGKYAMIGAGSVVTRNISDYVLACGNPAKPCGYVCECGKKLDEIFKCTCGKSYQLNEQRLQEC